MILAKWDLLPFRSYSNSLSTKGRLSVLFRGRWQLVKYDVVGSGIAGFNLSFRASRIQCLDLDRSRTGAFGNEVNVV